ncbi:MAG: 50S ribosomal protein L17 [Spirochaetia bacterium]|nr:50S ribosomal protein L17 [Spirochaetia bacterium]
MNKRNKVKHLHKSSAHRSAMLSNMVTSLFYHENIQSTVAKAKVAGQVAEKLITRAKGNLNSEKSEEKIHNIRLVSRFIKDKEVLNKLFNDIAPRVEKRNGGYTRVVKIGRRRSDSSEMAVLELVDKKPLPLIKEERKKNREAIKEKKVKKEKTAKA